MCIVKNRTGEELEGNIKYAEKRVCLVCGDTYDTGLLLPDKRPHNSNDFYTLTGTGLCPEHDKVHKEGFIALIEIDPEKSKFHGNYIKPHEAYRTGNVAHIRKTAADQIFDHELKGPVVYVEPGLIQKLQEIMKEG